MNSLSILGKYLDQPRLVGQIRRWTPVSLITAGAAYSLYDSGKEPKSMQRNKIIKNVAVLSSTIAFAVFSPRLTAKIMKDSEFKKFSFTMLKKENSKLIDNFLSENSVEPKVSKILTDAKNRVLGFKQIKTLFDSMKNNKSGQDFLDKLIPNPEYIDSKHIFDEIKKLSLLGAFPVLGGITGGILGDRMTEKNWRDKIPNKIKEGSYQYLANIFLCNVGAGAALWVLEKKNITSRSARTFGMIGGILLTGVIGGSIIANALGRILIDPLFKNKHKAANNLYSDRKPELLDVGLHVDDIATVGVMSGLKWIEPALPILYSISGYRAGIGYRNGGDAKNLIEDKLGNLIAFEQRRAFNSFN